MYSSNGVVRTMDRSLPTSAALAIAGERIVGGVGTHESALPTPDRVDPRGRCVVPAFTDAHVHFPTWSLARRDVLLEGAASLAEALERVRAHPRRGAWIRGTGWRDADWAEQPTRQALDEVTGATRRRSGRRTNTRSGSTPPRSPTPAATSTSRAASSSATGRVSRRAIVREESAWRFRERHVIVSEDELGRRHARGPQARERTRRDLDPRQGRLARRTRDLRAHPRPRRLTLRVWQSLPYDHTAELAELRLRAGLGDDYLRLGYLKAFMDGTLGSQTAWMLDGSGVVHHERR